MIFAVYSTDNDCLTESSIAEPLPSRDVIAHHRASVTYHLVEEGTKRGRAMLVDSLGFTYNVNAKRSYATYWQCTVRPKGNPCKASVAERDGTFQAGKNSHNHSAEVGTATARKIVTTVKAKALENKFKPASAIVNEVINSLVLCVKSPHSLVHVFWPKELVNITPYAAWRKLYELKIILSNTV